MTASTYRPGRTTGSRSRCPTRSFAATTAPGSVPVCGKDLNAEPHEHVEERIDPRWAKLSQLRQE